MPEKSSEEAEKRLREYGIVLGAPVYPETNFICVPHIPHMLLCTNLYLLMPPKQINLSLLPLIQRDEKIPIETLTKEDQETGERQQFGGIRL